VVGLAAVTYRWLHLHERCLAVAAGIATGFFDVLTSVPSTSGRVGTHPLVTLLTEVVVGSKDRYADLLVVNRPDLGPGEIVPDRFLATRAVPANVLVVDDSWVSGAKPQAAATALKVAGAKVRGHPGHRPVVHARLPAQPGLVAGETEGRVELGHLLSALSSGDPLSGRPVRRWEARRGPALGRNTHRCRCCLPAGPAGDPS